MTRFLRALGDIVTQPWLVIAPSEWRDLGAGTPCLNDDEAANITPGFWWRGFDVYNVRWSVQHCGLAIFALCGRGLAAHPGNVAAPTEALVGFLHRSNRRLLERYAEVLNVEAALS
jgi:hypothetical protein